MSSLNNINNINNIFTDKAIYNKEESLLQSLKNNQNQSFKDQLSIKKASQSLESIVLAKNIGMIFENINLNPLAEENSASKIYKSWLVNEISDVISKSSSLGIARDIEKQMVKQYQEMNKGDKEND